MDLFKRIGTNALLLIDDDEWVRGSLQLFFESEGCRVDALDTAEEGLEHSARQRFDIIISDYRLPGMDGVTFARRLPPAQSGALKILITAYGNPRLYAQARRAGYDELIAKPFTGRDIENCLRTYGIDRTGLGRLVETLSQRGKLLYLVDHREGQRTISPDEGRGHGDE